MLRELIPILRLEEAAPEGGTTLAGGAGPTPAEPGSALDSPETYKDTWYAGTSEEIYGDPSLSAFKNADGAIDGTKVLKSYVHAQKTMGEDKIKIPTEKSSDEDWKQFHQKMGLPEKEEDYKIIPDGTEVRNQEFLDAFKEIAYGQGILPAQAKKVVEFYDSYNQSQIENYQKKAEMDMAEELNNIKTEWGDAYDTKIASAKKAIETFGNENFTKFLNETQMGNHPEMIKMFALIGEGMNNDEIKGDNIVPNGKYTPEEAQRKINDTMADLEGPYFNKGHANHEDAVREMSNLFAMIP